MHGGQWGSAQWAVPGEWITRVGDAAATCKAQRLQRMQRPSVRPGAARGGPIFARGRPVQALRVPCRVREPRKRPHWPHSCTCASHGRVRRSSSGFRPGARGAPGAWGAPGKSSPEGRRTGAWGLADPNVNAIRPELIHYQASSVLSLQRPAVSGRVAPPASASRCSPGFLLHACGLQNA